MFRLSVLAERIRSRLWPIPTLAAVLAGVAALLLSTVRPPPGDSATWWAGEPSSTRGLLEVLAGSSLTVVALVLSLQVVALQLAATQYSPRLLRTYVRDPVIQAALSVLISTFVFNLVTLALFGTVDQPPRISVGVAVLLGLASVGALLGVVAHIVASLRVETMMADIHEDARRVIESHLRDLGPPGEPDPGPEQVVRAGRSGFVQAVDRRRLASWGRSHEARTEVDARPGDHVLEGAPLARVTGTDERPPTDAIRIGHERTPDDDPAYGLMQLSDIAVRALSPGINDTTTAVHAVGHLAALLAQLVQHPLGVPRVTADGDGHVRVVEAQRSLEEYLEVAFEPLLRSGSSYPRVLLALVELLRVAEQPPGGSQPVVDGLLDRLVRTARRDLEDADEVYRVLEAVKGSARAGR